ncbi:MAG: hypothetical protein R2763_10075 [Mycobacterium sp.]
MAVDIVLGVSMTPAAVRLVLVEGEKADGVTVDHDSFDSAPGDAGAAPDAIQQVIAAILGTRESALEGGHHLRSIGVGWTEHASAARLRQGLREHGVADVVLVSELHAASALAKAVGQTIGCDLIALLFVEAGTATLAVVRTADGVVVRVSSRDLHGADALTGVVEMVADLQGRPDPPGAVFVVGSGVDVDAMRAAVGARTGLPVHVPDDGELALARGAALASANIPQFEASTVGLAPEEDTAAGSTRLAAAGYMAPLGYSAVPDDTEEPIEGIADLDTGEEPEPGAAERKPFLLVGSALSAVFVVGIVALVAALAVAIRPTADQRPGPGGNAIVPGSHTSTPSAVQDAVAVTPETIQAPIPVVQEAPRTVFVAPPAAQPAAPVPAAPAVQPPAPAAPAPAPAPAAPAPAAPAPVAPAPIVLPVPMPALPPLLTSVFQHPAVATPAPRSPSTATTPTSSETPPETPSAPVSETSSAPSTSSATAPSPESSSPESSSQGSSSQGSSSQGSSSQGPSSSSSPTSSSASSGASSGSSAPGASSTSQAPGAGSGSEGSRSGGSGESSVVILPLSPAED